MAKLDRTKLNLFKNLFSKSISYKTGRDVILIAIVFVLMQEKRITND